MGRRTCLRRRKAVCTPSAFTFTSRCSRSGRSCSTMALSSLRILRHTHGMRAPPTEAHAVDRPYQQQPLVGGRGRMLRQPRPTSTMRKTCRRIPSSNATRNASASSVHNEHSIVTGKSCLLVEPNTNQKWKAHEGAATSAAPMTSMSTTGSKGAGDSSVTYLIIASCASLSHALALKTALIAPGSSGDSRLRTNAKRFTDLLSLIGTVFTKVVKDNPLPAPITQMKRSYYSGRPKIRL